MFTINLARLFVFFAALLSATGANASVTDIPGISPQDAYEQFKNQTALIVDVREHGELIESGMAEGALWLATSKMVDDSPEWRQFVDTTTREKLVIVYCRSGKRAQKAAVRLVENGFRAANMGAFEAWKKAGLPIVFPAVGL